MFGGGAGGPAPQAQQAVAGRALCTCVGPRLLCHHQRAACGVGAVELAGLGNGGLCCQLHTRMRFRQERELNLKHGDTDNSTD